MTDVLLLAAAALVGILALGMVGITPLLTLLAVTGLAVLPRATLDVEAIGLAEPLAVLVVLCIAPFTLFLRPRTSVPWLFLPLMVFLLAMGLVGWEGTETQWSGIGDILRAVAAFGIGSMLAELHREQRRFDRWLIVLVFGAVLFQALVAGLQTLGFELFSATSAAAELESGRASGSFGHPGNLGKALVMLAIIALPLTRSDDRVVRRFAIATLVAAFVPLGLSVSRSNIAAMAGAVLLWTFLLPRQKRFGARFALPFGAAIVGFAFLDQILARFREDPVGGARGHLMEVALAHIPDNLLIGVGPGSYIEYFGRFDTLTAAGWPVHDAYVLQLAEIGLVGAILLFVPVLVLIVRSIPRMRLPDERADWARAAVVLVPVLVVLGVTGWGLVSSAAFPLWMLTAAYVTRRALAPEPRPSAEAEAAAAEAAAAPASGDPRTGRLLARR